MVEVLRFKFSLKGSRKKWIFYDQGLKNTFFIKLSQNQNISISNVGIKKQLTVWGGMGGGVVDRSEAVGAIIKVLIVFHLPSVFPGRKCEILKLKYVIKSKVSISG